MSSSDKCSKAPRKGVRCVGGWVDEGDKVSVGVCVVRVG